ncbi:unnamed protein product [Amaranthus hypochondriacus]
METFVATTWICLVIMMMISMGVVSSPNQKYKTIQYDLNTGKNGYMKFLTEFRLALTRTSVCGIQTLSNSHDFIYVQLISSPTKNITVVHNTTNIHVLGYSDNVKVNGKTRARFFNNVDQGVMNKLFPDIETKMNTKLSENYNSLVEKTKYNRRNLELKVTTFETMFKEVYGKPVADLEHYSDNKKGQPEANFLFSMCQLIAEATRFKFMETSIVSRVGTKPLSEELYAFQNNWNTIAKRIHATVPKCDKLMKNITLGNIEYTTVAALKEKVTVIMDVKSVNVYYLRSYISISSNVDYI